MIDGLASLIAPMTTAEFLRRVARREPALIRGRQGDRFEALASWQTIEHLLAYGNLAASRISVRRDGTLIPEAFYLNNDTPPRVSPNALRQVLRRGASVSIELIDEIVPAIGRIAQAIEFELGTKVWVNGYFSFVKGGMFKTHYDNHEVVVLQVLGRKRWQLIGPPLLDPVDVFRSGTPQPTNILFEEVLEPGDVLYVPRGHYHRAMVEDEASAHLTIGIEGVTGIDVARWMTDRLKEEPLFRAYVPIWFDETAQGRHIHAIKERLKAYVDEIDVVSLLAHRAGLRKQVPALQLGPITPPVPNSILRLLLRRRPDLPHSVGAAVVVQLGGDMHTLSPDACQVLKAFGDKIELRYETLEALLPGLDSTAASAAVIDLQEAGLIHVAPSSRKPHSSPCDF